MRIQETNRILKEAAIGRQSASPEQDEGMMHRAWRIVSHLPQTITGLFRRH
jgi:hypothetical protein